MEAVQRRDPEEEEDEKLGVLIVGAGPVGLTLSILLSSYGVRSLVVERRSKLSDHPQAHFLNNRTMEIFRKMEGLSEEIETKQPPLEHWRRFVYCTTLAGRVLGTVDHLQPEGMLLAILIFLCFFLCQFWVDCHKSMPSKLAYDTFSLSFAKDLLLANWVR
jgi:hypothetical protein